MINYFSIEQNIKYQPYHSSYFFVTYKYNQETVLISIPLVYSK